LAAVKLDENVPELVGTVLRDGGHDVAHARDENLGGVDDERLPAAASAEDRAVVVRRDEVASRFGVQITSPARTIADVADIGADPSLVIDATARALASGLVSPSELRAATKDRSARVHQLVEKALHEAGARA
jgi:hypothetical protein